MAGIPQRRTQAGDRVIPVRHKQPQRRDRAQASQQDQDDRDPGRRGQPLATGHGAAVPVRTTRHPPARPCLITRHQVSLTGAN